MKRGILVFIMLMGAFTIFARQEAPVLTNEQNWVLAKAENFYKTAGVNISTKVVLNNFRELLASNQLCEPAFLPSVNIQLEGKRLDEKSTFLTWNVLEEKNNARYVIERRFISPHGRFDSVGVIDAPRKHSPIQSYHFGDANDFPGITWYRLRRIGQKEETKLISVKGYNSSVRILPNPTTSPDVYILLTKFKTDDNTSIIITDSRGSLVRTVSRAFNGSNVYQLKQLRLPQGVYHVKVFNQFSSCSTTFVIQ